MKRLDELDPIPLPWTSDEEALKDFWDYCCLLYTSGGRKIQLVINSNHGEELVADVDHVKEGALYLKVVVEKLTRTFYYSCDGENWEQVGVLENCIYLCDEGVPDRKSTRLNSSHSDRSRMPSSA